MKLGALDYVPKTVKDLYEVLRRKVGEALETGQESESAEPPVMALIKEGESATLEFKSSLRWDMREGKLNKGLERVIVKTVAAFMNSEGECNLLIGVDDDGSVVGIRHDYATLGRKKDRDGFENLLVTIILDACGKDCAPLIRVLFHQVGEAEVCQVTIKPSTKPVFVKDDKDELFYVRTGNSTRQLNTREALEYCKLRWRTPA
jgi:predicted HTH transcriptional regulator